MLGEILSGLVGAILGSGISFLTLKYNYRDLYARNISKNRMDWINNFRDELAIIIAALECKKDHETIYNACKARAKIQTRLNLDISKEGNEYNQAMSDLLCSINFYESYDSVTKDKLVKKLVSLTRKILEPEWQRVKQEAKGR